MSAYCETRKARSSLTACTIPPRHPSFSAYRVVSRALVVFYDARIPSTSIISFCRNKEETETRVLGFQGHTRASTPSAISLCLMSPAGQRRRLVPSLSGNVSHVMFVDSSRHLDSPPAHLTLAPTSPRPSPVSPFKAHRHDHGPLSYLRRVHPCSRLPLAFPPCWRPEPRELSSTSTLGRTHRVQVATSSTTARPSSS